MKQVIQTFTGNGSFVCPAGVLFVWLSGCGGGGGGGGGAGPANNEVSLSGGGGGGGGGAPLSSLMIPVTPGTTYTVTIGGGGAGGSGQSGTNGSTGNNGSSTTFSDGSTMNVTMLGGSSGEGGLRMATGTNTQSFGVIGGQPYVGSGSGSEFMTTSTPRQAMNLVAVDSGDNIPFARFPGAGGFGVGAQYAGTIPSAATATRAANQAAEYNAAGSAGFTPAAGGGTGNISGTNIGGGPGGGGGTGPRGVGGTGGTGGNGNNAGAAGTSTAGGTAGANTGAGGGGGGGGGSGSTTSSTGQNGGTGGSGFLQVAYFN